ncbi:MAG: hypothetical protein ACTSUO_00365 [Candidatus Thorarchaeota archaeon]
MIGKEYDWSNLPDGFEFGLVETDDELDEFLAFNATMHEPEDAEFLKRLIENLPNFSREMNFYIRDIDKGIIVASMNSIPSIWEYDGIPLSNLELGFVGTLPDYRRKGFQQIIHSYFDNVLLKGKYDISTIQGIPYFYRDNFGYDFILPLHQKVTIRVDQIPTSSDKGPLSSDIVIRPAEESDREQIIKLYNELKERLLVAAQRSDALWDVQERLRFDNRWIWDTMVLERNGKIDGYFRMIVRGKPSDVSYNVGLEIIESSIRSYDSVMTTLTYLRIQALNKELSLVVVPNTSASNLCRVTLNMGGVATPGWKHMVRIPDITHFLNKIRPVLEHRLHGTMFEGLTLELALNTYRNCYLLNFVDGILDPITDIGMQETDARQEIRMPPEDFVRLLLGAYTLEQLNETNIDFIVRGSRKALLESLFPKKESYIFLYHC